MGLSQPLVLIAVSAVILSEWRQPVPATGSLLADAVLVPMGSDWRYLDDGSDQGTAWRASDFPDDEWPVGPAQLGYGDGDEATVVSFGPDPSAKFITTYFRHEFVVPDASVFRGATLQVLRDDGAAVYLNGVEVARSNMPDGPVDHLTLPKEPLIVPDETWIQPLPIDASLLQTGDNVLAVEIHQRNDGSGSDLSFDLELVGSTVVAVTRGPYLQRLAPDSVVLRWRTNRPNRSGVWVGTSVNDLDLVASDGKRVTDHEVAVSGLDPDSEYFYAVGTRSRILAGNDPEHRFRTPPPIGVARPTRILALGDTGEPTADAEAVRDAFTTHLGGQAPDVWLPLGDLAYPSGEDSEFQMGFFDLYDSLLRQTCSWPSLGNHDAASAVSATESGVYYDAFTLPRQGEAGGAPSGTEAYYSFDHGDIHFICLNSEDVDRAVTGAMISWLQADLAATSAPWIIAYSHRPPYSKGWNVDSDNSLGGNEGSVEIREHILPILEAAGVDLFLAGHSHAYERSYLLDGHYGFSDTLTPEMKLDRGDGREGGDGSYAKATLAKGANQGAVYVVAGSGAEAATAPLDHPAMAVSLSNLGSVVIDIDGNRLDATFVDATGAVLDEFTLLKGVVRSLTRDEPRIAPAIGGTQNFFLEAGAEHAGRGYVLAGAFGTSPGFYAGAIHVPLNIDEWLNLSLLAVNSSFYPSSAGFLDVDGDAQAAFVVSPFPNNPSLIGLEIHHAYVVYDFPDFLMASNPVKVTLVPN